MDKDQGQEELVPGAQKGQDRDGSQSRLGDRKDHTEERSEMRAPINARCVAVVSRDSVVKGPQDEYSQGGGRRPCREGSGQEVGIYQM